MLQARNSMSGGLKTSLIHGNIANRSNKTQIPGPAPGPLDQNCWSWGLDICIFSKLCRFSLKGHQ